jgi:predicted nucleic acid-binding protein
MIVLDASVVVDLLLDRPPAAAEIRARIMADPDIPAAPALLDAEVGQVLRRFVLAGVMTVERAAGALDDLFDLSLHRYPLTQLIHRAFELRDNTTFYDALYLTLAEALRAPLLTRDAALATVPGHRARVVVV